MTSAQRREMRCWSRIGLAGLAVSVLGAALLIQAAVASPPQASVRVVATTATGLLLEMTAPLPTITTQMHTGAPVARLTLPGAWIDAQPGTLPLPVLGVLAALPPDGAARVRIVADAAVTMTLPAPLPVNAPATAISLAIAASDDGAPLTTLPAPLTAQGASNLPPLTQTLPAELTGVEHWRSQTVASVTFRPVTVTPDGAQLVVHQRLLVALDFASSARAASVYDPAPDADVFETLLQATVVNYEQGRDWRQRPSSLISTVGAVLQDDQWWRVHVPASGMVRIDCMALAAAGAPVDAAPPTLWRVQRDGKQGPVLATATHNDNGDGHCDAGEGFSFYAVPQPTPYAADAVFWLSIAPAPGAAIATVTPPASTGRQTSYLHTDRYESNRLYYSYIPLTEGAEHWYWDILTPAISIARSYPFTVSERADAGDARITLTLAGYDGAHVTEVAVNAQIAAHVAWQGRTPQTIAASVPVTWLQPGVNTLRVTALGPSPDLQYVDAFTVGYPRQLVAQADRLTFTALGAQQLTLAGFNAPEVAVYNLADPDHPRRLAATVTAPCPCAVAFDTPAGADAPYLALTAAQVITPTAIVAAPAADLLAPATGADYLILTPAELAPALEPLVAQRRRAGLRVRVVDAQAVYDDFGDGRRDPAAIQRFLLHTLAAWPAPAPAYVLLVGDGSYDPRGFVTPPAPTIPAWLRLVDPVIGETASDHRYVTAALDSQLPQMMIGRLPAHTAEEVAGMVAKILAFEAAPAAATWRRQALLVADNAYQSDGRPDPAGDFWALADRAASLLTTGGVDVTRLYYNPCAATTAAACNLPDPPYPRYGDAAVLTADLLARVNAGRGLVIYTGHASPLSWAGAPYLLRASDIAALTSSAPPFVALEMSCYTGFFHGRYESLAETLLRAPGGAVASWASSGQSAVRGQDVLLERLLTTLLTDAPAGVTLGQAVLAAKLHLYGAGGGAYAAALDTFHLFGDPALVMQAAAPATPTATPTPSATVPAVDTPTPSSTPLVTATSLVSATPSATATAAPTATATPSPSPVSTPLSAVTPTPQPQTAAHIFLPVVQTARDPAVTNPTQAPP